MFEKTSLCKNMKKNIPGLLYDLNLASGSLASFIVYLVTI